MVKPRKGTTLMDFLHLQKDSDEENCDVENAQELTIEGIEEETAPKDEGQETTRIYTVQEVTSRIRRILDEDVELRDV
jgi:hypothetical protein